MKNKTMKNSLLIDIGNSNTEYVQYQELAFTNISNTQTKSLESSALINNNIGDDGMVALAKALHRNRTIEIVNLSYNDIGDPGIYALCDALAVNESFILFSIPKLNVSGKVSDPD